MIKDALTLEEVEYKLNQFELVGELEGFIQLSGEASDEFKENVEQWKHLLWNGEELPQLAQLLL